MTDVHEELSKANASIQPPIEFKLPLFITNTQTGVLSFVTAWTGAKMRGDRVGTDLG